MRQYGDVQKWFDLSNKRGLAFCTYYDLRAAERAKAGMMNYLVNGRNINVHFSLPKDEDQSQRCDRTKNQGTLFVALRNGHKPLEDADLYTAFARFGDIKCVRPNYELPNARFLEFYDARACVAAHDAMRLQPYAGGDWDIRFAWDLLMSEAEYYGTNGGPGMANQNQGMAPPPQHQQQPQGAYGGGWGGAPMNMPPQQQGGPMMGGGGMMMMPPPLNAPTGPAAQQAPQQQAQQPMPDLDRLSQAQKVQQLLESLRGMPSTTTTNTATPPHAPGRSPAPAISSPQPAPAAAAPASAALPPNLAALLGSLGSTTSAPPSNPSSAPTNGVPPRANPVSPPRPSNVPAQASMQELLSMLVSVLAPWNRLRTLADPPPFPQQQKAKK